MLRAYKYRLFPNEEQTTMFAKTFGCTRFVFNWGLAKKIAHYEAYKKAKEEADAAGEKLEMKKSLSRFDLGKQLTGLRQEHLFLQEVCCQSLHNAILNLDYAYKNFFKKHNRFPSFKSRDNKQSFQCPQGTKVNFEKGTLKIPKIYGIKTVFHREFEGKIKTVTISRTCAYKHYVSILVDDGKELPEKIEPNKEKAIGIKCGINEDYFAMLSNGEIIEELKPLTKSSKRLKIIQRRLSRKVKGSKNREKQRIKLASLHEKISSRRHDFLHKLSTRIVDNYECICLKDDALKQKLEEETKEMAKDLADNSFGIFKTFLIYKTEWKGHNTIFVKNKGDDECLNPEEILEEAFEELREKDK